MSEHSKALLPRLQETAKKERASLTEEERKVRYGHGKNKGKHHSKEIRKKMSYAAKGRDMSKAIAVASSKNRKPILQIHNGVIINTFCSISEASKVLNINTSNISACIAGKRKTAGNYSWKLKNRKESMYVY